MRVVFLGTPEFAVPSLQILIDSGHQVVAVVTQPDRPSGRGHHLQAPPIKVCAENHGLPIYQPEKIRLEENREIFGEMAADFIVVVAYGQILPGWLLQSARVAAVNVHGSILPKYRGAAPVVWTILNGDCSSGVTTMLMVEKLDAGPILLSREVSVNQDITSGELACQLASLGAALLAETLDRLKGGSIQPLTQDERQVTWAPRITKEMAQISWERSAREVHNQIRGLNPWPTAYTERHSQRLHIWRSGLTETAGGADTKPGTFLGFTETGMLIQCGGSTVLEVLEVQTQGKKRISGRAFANGARLSALQAVFGPAGSF
jgi:methionyl-tRNA formyltransferase